MMTTSIQDPVTVDAFVQHLRQRGIELTVDHDVLRVSAPKGVVDAALAEQIAGRKAGLLSYLKISYLKANHEQAPSTIRRISRTEPLPLGFVQQRMWLHQQLEPDTPLYNLPAAWRLTGPLELEAFLRAFGDVVARHEILRVSIRAGNNEPTQSFEPAGGNALDIEDLTSIPAADRERELMARLLALRDETIDLEQGPPFRARLFRVAADEHVLFLMPHHVVWDGWSFDIFLRDFGEIYAAAIDGRPALLPDLPIQYADYALWHRHWLQDGALQQQLAYWSDVLAGERTPLDLPVDFPRPKRFSYRGDWEEFSICASTIERITRLAARHRSTSFMVLLSAWGAFIHRLSGQQDIVVGVPIQARQSPEVSNLIGCFVNTLCLRLRMDPESSFEQLIEDVRGSSLGAYEHQDTPVDMLVDRFVTQRDPSRTPLFQTMFSHQQVSRRPGQLGGLSVSQVHVNPGATPTDLMLAVMEGSTGARGVIHYSTDLFAPSTIRHLRLRFEYFLAAALAAPATCIGALPMLTPEERSTVLTRWNSTTRDVVAHSTASELLSPPAWHTTQTPALHFGAQAISYAELDARANRLARLLRSRGVGRGALVGLCVERSLEMVVAQLAILRAGAAYVPLDPAYPADRLAFMAGDARLALLVTASALAPILDWPRNRSVWLDTDSIAVACQADAAVEPDAALDARPEDPAYVIYTSGSTGTPKGVMVPHRALVNFLGSMAREPGLRCSDRLLAVTTLSFDIAALELLLPLSIGAEVILASRDEAIYGDALRALLESSRATAMQATPSTWRLLIDAGWMGGKDFKALVGGEGLPPDLARQLLDRTGQLWNMYGPTETTVWSTCWKVQQPEKGISIGRPIANTQVHVFDERQQLCPIGVYGEICIGGDGVALGYLHQPGLTAERFIADPFSNDPHARLYRTGDRGRWRFDGQLEHFGRLDFQVKVHGHRIELGEIEAHLLACADIAQAVVIAREDRPGDVRLVAYAIAEAGRKIDQPTLLAQLKRTLPAYLLPQHIVGLDAMPLLPNGKIDRKALLPPPAGTVPVEQTSRAVARAGQSDDRRVSYLLAIWSELLGSQARPDDNFFDLGGHSMLAVQMANRVARDTGVRIKLMRLATQTLEQIAMELPLSTGGETSEGMGARIARGFKRLFANDKEVTP